MGKEKKKNKMHRLTLRGKKVKIQSWKLLQVVYTIISIANRKQINTQTEKHKHTETLNGEKNTDYKQQTNFSKQYEKSDRTSEIEMSKPVVIDSDILITTDMTSFLTSTIRMIREYIRNSDDVIWMCQL